MAERIEPKPVAGPAALNYPGPIGGAEDAVDQLAGVRRRRARLSVRRAPDESGAGPKVEGGQSDLTSNANYRLATLNLMEDADTARRQQHIEALERSRAEKEAERSALRLRILFESMTEGFALIEAISSTGGPIEFFECNRAFERLLGLSNFATTSRAGQQRHRFAEIRPLFDRSELAKLTRAIDDAKPVEFETYLQDLDRWLNISVSPVEYVEGRRLALVVSDITNRKHADNVVQQTQSRLIAALADAESARQVAEAATTAKDQFLALVSHELRTPLTPIMLAAEIMTQSKALPAAAREAIEMIARNVRLEKRLVDDLLDVTRIARGKMEVVRLPMDLHEAIARAIEVAKGDLDAKGQHLCVDLAASGHEVDGDSTRLTQVFWNIVKNASKFTPNGGDVSVRTRNDDGKIVVEIADNGIGIETEAIAHVFDAFFQADSNHGRGGLGLGLAIAHATVGAHDGELTVASEGEGRGARFTVVLPLQAGN